MKVYSNCETIDDVKQAVQMGAEGIGLCRTEHMFFKENRIDLMVSKILYIFYNTNTNTYDNKRLVLS